MRVVWAGLALLALTNCVGTPKAVDCRDPDLQRFVGQPLSVLEAELRLPEDEYKVDYPSPYGPTLEEFPDRLRISVDEAGVIRSIGCG